MKILHTADLHLGDLAGPVKNGKNARREDTLNCMRAIVRSAETEKPDLIVIAGDLFNRSKVWADTALEDINDAITKFLIPLCNTGKEVILLFGTGNHDNLKAFETLRQLTNDQTNLHIKTKPEIFELAIDNETIQIMALPGFDKSWLRTFMPDADAREENLNGTKLVNNMIIESAQNLDPHKPSILIGHYTVAGAKGETSQTFLASQDVAILPQTIDRAGINLSLFGHIHKPQKLPCNMPAFYCGSPNELTFNEEGIPHGFFYHIMEHGVVTESRFVETPARKHLTISLSKDQIDEFLNTGKLDPIDPRIKDSVVRIFYEATEEQNQKLDQSALQSFMLNKAKAFHMASCIRQEPEDVPDIDPGLADTPEHALNDYLLFLKDNDTDLKLDDKDVQRLKNAALPILAKADDSKNLNRHTGAFLPKRIEVSNYRSYQKAEFNFETIRMAMVNGPNGVGKSSLFMDAIADCIYEQGREKGAGEWLRAGEKKGSIIFEFETGGETYRVSRTRNGSGKGTLALAKKNEATGEWENESDTTMRLTQQKIENLIGMDCQTFCSVALIRQDAYGLFLESDSNHRMEVLSTLLNLDVYTRAEEIAREKALNQKRIIAQLNDRMEVLNEQILKETELKQELTDTEVLYKTEENNHQMTEALIKETEKKETLRLELLKQIANKQREISELHLQTEKKRNDLKEQEENQKKAEDLCLISDKADEAFAFIQAAQKELEPLIRDEENLKNLNEKLMTLNSNTEAVNRALEELSKQKAETEGILSNKTEIENAAKELLLLNEERQALIPKLSEHDRLSQDLLLLEKSKAEASAKNKSMIDNLSYQILELDKKSELLQKSGCLDIERADCEFLKDAKNARSKKNALEKKLNDTKLLYAEEEKKLNTEHESLTLKLQGLNNPQQILAGLTEKEKALTPLASQAGKLEAAEASLKELSKQELDKQDLLKQYEKERTETEAQIKTLAVSGEKAEALKAKIKEAEPVAALKEQCASAKAAVKALNAPIMMLKEDIKKQDEKLTILQRELNDLVITTPQADANLPDLKQKLQDIITKEQELKKTEGGIQAKLESILEAKKQWKDFSDEKDAAVKLSVDYQILAKAFSLDGIQRIIIKNIIPEIEQRTNQILQAMTGGSMHVAFKTEREQTNKKVVNNLDVWVDTFSRPARPYSSHSGGEKVKIALAVTLSLADMKAHRAGVRLNMLWIDEPPFLDAEGTEAYADALITMANKNPDMRILAISHDPQMKARFPQNITVSAGPAGSVVHMQ